MQVGEQVRQARQLIRDVRSLVRRFQVAERADVSCCGMTVAQAATINVLHLEGALRLSALSRRLGIAPSTLTRNLKRMEGLGLIERIPDPDDGRAALLQLSAAGRRQGQLLEERNESAAHELLQSLPPERRRRLLSGLGDLLRALESAERCEPEGCGRSVEPTSESGAERS